MSNQSNTRCVLLAAALILSTSSQSATIVVDTLSGQGIGGDGQCSLLEAVLAATLNFGFDNCAAGEAGNPDEIRFDAALFPDIFEGSYAINLQSRLNVGNGDLSIVGPGDGLISETPLLTLNGDGTESIFSVDQIPGESFAISGLTISGGSTTASGGGVVIVDGTGQLTLTNVTFSGNSADVNGGAVAVTSDDAITVTISDSDFEMNTASGDGGAVHLQTPASTTWTATIGDSRFSGNEAGDEGGAVWMDGVDNSAVPRLTVTSSVFLMNESQGNGGGIAYDSRSSGSLSVSDSRFDQNRSVAGIGGGVIAVSVANSGTATLRRNYFIANSAENGGGALFIDEIRQYVINNLFQANTAGQDAGAVRISFAQAPASNVSHYTANTFYQNVGGLSTGSTVANELSVRTADSNPQGQLTFTGNLWLYSPTASNVACRFIGSTTTQIVGEHNATNHESCQIDAADIVSDDLRISPIFVPATNIFEGFFPMLEANTEAVDSWPDSDCVDPFGASLNDTVLNDLPRQTAGVPTLGNRLTANGCDPGAMESFASDLVTVTLAGAGSGVVTSNYQGIDCGAACSSVFWSSFLNDSVELSAVASSGSVFAGWSGDCSGTGTCQKGFTGGDMSVTATFDLAVTHTLSTTLAGLGNGQVTSSPAGIDCGLTCSNEFVEGTVVTLTAQATDLDSEFAGWSGACSGTGTCMVTLNANRSVTATFDSLVRDLDVTVDGPGSVTSLPIGIDCPADCSETYDLDTNVSLTATPATEAQFFGWSGDCDGEAGCGLVMSAARSVTAEFDFVYTLTTSVTGNGSITSADGLVDCPDVSCEVEYRDRDVIILDATPDVGWQFDGWSGACAGTGDCTIQISSDRSLTATFSRSEQVLTVATAGSGNGRVVSTPLGIDCPGTCTVGFNQGTVVSLLPQPGPGMAFTAWTGACTGSGACSVTMDQDRSVAALFEPASLSLSITIVTQGAGAGSVTSAPAGLDCPGSCETTFDGGQTITLTATPAEGSFFAGWNGACNGQGTCEVFLNEAKSVQATFSDQDVIFVSGFE